MEGLPKQENIRSENELSLIVNEAIEEMIEIFREEMSERDKDIFTALSKEQGTTFPGRIVALRQIEDYAGTVEEKEKRKAFVNQVMETLRQKLHGAEKDKLKGWSEGHHLLNDL